MCSGNRAKTRAVMVEPSSGLMARTQMACLGRMCGLRLVASRPAGILQRPRSEGFLPGETLPTWTVRGHGQVSSLQVRLLQQGGKMARSQWYRPQNLGVSSQELRSAWGLWAFLLHFLLRWGCLPDSLPMIICLKDSDYLVSQAHS